MRRAVAKLYLPGMQLPAFRSDEEERAFLESHNLGDYLATTLPVQVWVSRRIRDRVRTRKQNLTLRMKPSQIKEIKAGVDERGAP